MPCSEKEEPMSGNGNPQVKDVEGNWHELILQEDGWYRCEHGKGIKVN